MGRLVLPINSGFRSHPLFKTRTQNYDILRRKKNDYYICLPIENIYYQMLRILDLTPYDLLFAKICILIRYMSDTHPPSCCLSSSAKRSTCETSPIDQSL